MNEWVSMRELYTVWNSTGKGNKTRNKVFIAFTNKQIVSYNWQGSPVVCRELKVDSTSRPMNERWKVMTSSGRSYTCFAIKWGKEKEAELKRDGLNIFIICLIC